MPSITAMVAFGIVRKRSTIAWKPLSSDVASRVVGGQRRDERDVGVGGEELGVGGVEDHDAYGVVGLHFAAEAVELDDEREVEEVDRRMVDRRPGDSLPDADPERFVIVVRHGGECRSSK